MPIIFIIASLLAGGRRAHLDAQGGRASDRVPVVDVMISFPARRQLRSRTSLPSTLSGSLEIDGVEYIYSPLIGSAVVTCRFYVGENFETSVLKVQNKIMSVTWIRFRLVSDRWVVRPVDVNDVPIVYVLPI